MPHLPTIDFLKGLLIFLVIFGHALQFVVFDNNGDFWTDPTFQLVYMLHMPLFAAVSGYLTLADRSGLKHYILKRGERMLLPATIYITLFSLLVTCIPPVSHLPHPPPQLPFWTLWGIYMVFFYWFINCIFVAGLLVQVLPSARLWKGLALGVISALLIMLQVEKWGMPFGKILYFFGFMLPFFIAGHFWRISKFSIPRGKPTLIVAGVLAVAGGLLWATCRPFDFIYINKLDVWAYPLSVARMFASGFVLGGLAALLMVNLHRHLPPMVTRPAEWCGRHSLGLYLLSTVIFIFYLGYPHNRVTSLLNTVVGAIPHTSTFMRILLAALITVLLIVLVERLLQVWVIIRAQFPYPVAKLSSKEQR